MTALRQADGDATMSTCGTYRAFLWRWWGVGSIRLSECALFVMLNPSTADAVRDDPTIRRCVGFARAAGCDGVAVVNLFQMRATDPKALLRSVVPLNPNDADSVLAEAFAKARMLVGAWGRVHPTLAWRVNDVCVMADRANKTLHHLGLTNGGAPRHPLYVRRSVRPMALNDMNSRGGRVQGAKTN